LATVGLALLFAAAPAFGANVLSNPGFESGVLSPWYQYAGAAGGEDWNVTSAQAHTGTYCATDVGNKGLRQDFAAIPTSAITEVSFWVKQPDIELTAAILFYSDATSEQKTVFLTTSDWEFFDVTSELDVGKSLVGVAVWGFQGGSGAEDRTYLDDVTIATATIPLPAAAWLALPLLGSMAGVGAVRARKRKT